MDLLRLYLTEDYALAATVSVWLVAVLAAAVLAALLITRRLRPPWKELEIDEAELGIGNQKLKVRPNYADAQIAYQMWVELST